MSLGKLPAISVIIPTYNRARFVTKAINSVLSQSFRDYEIIVVDDGSSDNTQEVLKPYTKKINYIFQKNSGVSTARNKGIKIARGKWIAFLDSDDEWLPEKLSIQFKELSNNPELCAHLTNVSLINVDGKRTNYFQLRKCMHPNDKFCILARPFIHVLKNQIFLSGLIVKKTSIINAGWFNKRLSLFEDFDLSLRLTLEGAWGINNTELVYLIRRDEQKIALSFLGRDNEIYKLDCMNYILNKFIDDGYFNNLTKEEQDCFKKQFSSNLFLLGAEQAIRNEKKKSFDSFKKALIVHKSFKSIIKYIYYLIIGTFGKKIMKIRSRRKKYYR